MSTSHPKTFWNQLKLINKGNISPSNSINANSWTDHFSSLNSALPPPDDPHVKNITDRVSEELSTLNSPCPFLDKQFDIKEIKDGIKRLKNGKASASDSISNEVLKSACNFIAPTLTAFFNKLLDLEYFPDHWATGLIIPLHKSGELNDPDNYRGITLNSCVSKLFTMLCNDRLVNFCDHNQLIDYSQIGFRKGFRTADHVFTLKTIVNDALDNNKKIYACFVDFKKAYDSVWREGLLFKLLRYGVSKKFVKLLNDMYARIKTCISLPNGLSLPFRSLIGLKQGCNLSPILFNLFINDFVSQLNSESCDPPRLGSINVSCLLYADDLVLLSNSSCGLQKALATLGSFANTWHLKVNYKKTKCMIFEKRKCKQLPTFTLETNILTNCNSYCYLGINFTKNGAMKCASQILITKARNAMFSILKSVYKYKSCNVPIMIDLFDKMVIPIAMYNSEVWGVDLIPVNTSNNDLLSHKNVKHPVERLQCNFLKRILGTGDKSSNWAVMSEMGRHPILTKVIAILVKYFFHLCTTKSPILSAALCIDMSKTGKSSWFSRVKRVMSYCNIDHLLYTSDAVEVDHQLKSLKGKIRAIAINCWEQDKSRYAVNSKLDTYCEIKDSFGMSEYVLKCDNFQLRRAIAKMRISDHRFPIEIGRYEKIGRPQRICTLCFENIGDEKHYLFECQQKELKQMRTPLLRELHDIQPHLTNMSIDTKLKYLLKCTTMEEVIIAGRLCKGTLDTYKELAF